MGNRGKKTLFLTALLLCCGMMLGAKSMMLGAKSVVQDTERTERGAKARQHVLVLAERGGQHEAFTQTGLQWLRQQADTLGFDMTVVADCHRLKAGDIGGYDLVVQLNYPPYAWNEAAAREFEQAVDSGTVAWVGFHHASLLGEFDGYQMWQWFSDFLGGIRYQNYIAEKADGEVTVEYNNTNLFLTFDNFYVVCRLVDGRYPNYEAAIPKDNPNKLIVDRQSLLNTLRRVSIFASEATRQVRLSIAADHLVVSAEDLEFSNKAHESIPCQYEGDPMDIGFNAKFLTEMIGNLDSEQVLVEMSHPSRAGIIFPYGDETEGRPDDILMLVMPVMLAN